MQNGHSMEKMPNLAHKIITCNVKFSVQAKRKKRNPRPKPLSAPPCVHKKHSTAYCCWVSVKFSVLAKRKKHHPRPKPLSAPPCVHKKKSAAYRCWVSGRNSSAVSHKKLSNKITGVTGASFSPRERKKTPAPGTPRPIHTKPSVSVPSFVRQKNSVAHPGGNRWVAQRTNSIPFLLRKKHSAAYRCWQARRTTSLFVATGTYMLTAFLIERIFCLLFLRFCFFAFLLFLLFLL